MDRLEARQWTTISERRMSSRVELGRGRSHGNECRTVVKGESSTGVEVVGKREKAGSVGRGYDALKASQPVRRQESLMVGSVETMARTGLMVLRSFPKSESSRGGKTDVISYFGTTMEVTSNRQFRRTRCERGTPRISIVMPTP